MEIGLQEICNLQVIQIGEINPVNGRWNQTRIMFL